MQSMAIANPRTGEPDIDLPVFEQHDVSANVGPLRDNQKAWWDNGLTFRINTLLALVDALDDNRQALIDALINDTGRASESALEVDVTIGTIKRWCAQAPELLAPAGKKNAEIPFIEIQQSYLPYSVVGVISPWNFPLLLSLVDAIPALLAGSAVVIKPSEVTSRFVAPFQATLNAIPDLSAVLTLVTGAGETGQAVIQQVDSLCFTGSVTTGRKLAEICARRFIPAFLELGGKDPAIVCADADIDLAAKALCWGSMVNAGQSCMSLERVYVHQSVADEFITKLVAQVETLSHNYPDIMQGQIGPIISQKQVDLVKSQLRDAKEKGAQILCGGEVVELGGGKYCQPTILTNVNDDMALVANETFAAILPVIPVESDEEAVLKANDSDYGLSAAVFSQDLEHAYSIANQLEAGAISINDASLTALIHEAEKQSFKYSGLGGSRMGAESIRRFIRKKAFIRNTGVPSPWWFA